VNIENEMDPRARLASTLSKQICYSKCVTNNHRIMFDD
jgi:hypothetical protein